MFEIVKVILESIVKVLDPEKVLVARRSGKLNQIGTRLYMLYIHLNEIAIYGKSLVIEIENYLASWEKNETSNSDLHYWSKNHLDPCSCSLVR